MTTRKHLLHTLAVLVLDLSRPHPVRVGIDGCSELAPFWDLVISVDVDFDVVLRRGIERDRAWMGSAAEARYRAKYIPGERMYVEQVRPAEGAHIVIDNRDPRSPELFLRNI